MKCTEERFLKDIGTHVLEIVRDDGVHRHLKFRKPESSDQFFELITWPGSLCYSGDMGTFVFSRLKDMFEFFRTDAKYMKNDGLRINPSYWEEKLTATDRSGSRVYSPDLFVSKAQNWVKDLDFTSEDQRDFEDRVLSWADEGEERARTAADEFSITRDDGTIIEDIFIDFFEVNLTEFTFRYLWCCYAIAWGVQKYDEAKTWRETFDV